MAPSAYVFISLILAVTVASANKEHCHADSGDDCMLTGRSLLQVTVGHQSSPLPSGLKGLEDRINDVLHGLDANSPAAQQIELASDMTGAIMLIGAISFMMVIFYLVNWPDNDIQYYSYNTVSSSISIFSAVLAYSALSNCLKTIFLSKLGTHGPLILESCHFLFWFTFLQILTALLVGAFSEDLPEPNEIEDEEECERVKAIWEQRELNVKCWAGLTTHITAFAAIGCFIEIQQLSFFSASPFRSLLAVPFGFFITTILTRISDNVRYYISLMGDGEVGKAEEIWDKEAEESENDIVSLSLSFVTLQSIRFAISGALPALAGFGSDDAVDVGLSGDGASSTVRYLLLVAVVSVALSLSLGVAFNHLYNKLKGYEGLDKRATLVGVLFFSMLFAWSVLFSFKAMAGVFISTLPTMMQSVSIALAVSFMAFSAIFILDKIADCSADRSDLLEMLICLIESHGLLVGLGWEASFDAAVDTICGDNATFNLILSLIICAIVVPANYLYLIPAVEKAKSHARGGIEEEEESEGESDEKPELNQEAVKKLDKIEEHLRKRQEEIKEQKGKNNPAKEATEAKEDSEPEHFFESRGQQHLKAGGDM